MAYVTNIKTVITYDLDNSNKNFTIPFEYLSRTFIVITLIGVDRKVLEITTDYTFSNSTEITTNQVWGPTQGYDQIEIRRQTSASDRIVDFQNGSVLRAGDLNTANIQSLHLAEEARDLVSDTIATDNDGNLDARGRKLTNLGDGTEDGDAVNLRQQKAWASSALNQADRAKTEADRATAQAITATTQAGIATNQANISTISATAAVAAKNAATTKASEAAASAATATNQANISTTQAGIATTKASEALASAASAKTDADRAQSANPDNQLKKANNLSDVVSVATSRTNLDVYSKAESDAKAGGYVSQTIWHHSRIAAGIPGGYVLGDGQLLSRTVWPDLWAMVRDGKVPVVTEAVWSSTVTTRSNYTVGDGTNTFRVPDLNGVQSGSIAGPFLRGGNVVSSIQMNAAPNILGDMDAAAAVALQTLTGSFQASGNKYYAPQHNTATTQQFTHFNFDASRSNAAYGRDGAIEIRPNSVNGVYLIRAAGLVDNPGLVDVSAIAIKVDAIADITTSLIGGGRWLNWNDPIVAEYLNFSVQQANTGDPDALLVRFGVNGVEIRGSVTKNFTAGLRYICKVIKAPAGFTKCKVVPTFGIESNSYRIIYIAPTTMDVIDPAIATANVVSLAAVVTPNPLWWMGNILIKFGN